MPVLGNSEVGKTALISRYTKAFLPQVYEPTKRGMSKSVHKANVHVIIY